MCFAAILALILFPLGGWLIGAHAGPAGGWIGLAIGLVVALALAGAPAAAFLGIEKRKYDRDNPDTDA